MRRWQTRAHGIAALKNVMDFFGAKTPDLHKLIMVSLSIENTYDPKRGWTYEGLADIAIHYKLRAAPYDWSGKESDDAFYELQRAVKHMPCLTSIKNKFSPHADHWVIIKKITGGRVFYKRPSLKIQSEKMRVTSVDAFLKRWKRRGVIVRR